MTNNKRKKISVETSEKAKKPSGITSAVIKASLALGIVGTGAAVLNPWEEAPQKPALVQQKYYNDPDTLRKFKEVEAKGGEVLKKLGITETDDFDKQMKQAEKIFMYVVENSEYTESALRMRTLQKTAADIEVTDIHQMLTRRESVCAGDAASLSYLLRRAGLDAYTLYIYNKDGKSGHAVTVLKTPQEIDLVLDPTNYRVALEKGDIQKGTGFVSTVSDYQKAYKFPISFAEAWKAPYENILRGEINREQREQIKE